jgi:hypothetical protein
MKAFHYSTGPPLAQSARPPALIFDAIDEVLPHRVAVDSHAQPTTGLPFRLTSNLLADRCDSN